jgi:hypothetical protein
MSTQTIDIGTKINLQDLLVTRMLIQANSGGGKSALARKIMEECNGKVPFIVLDYDGEYYTLKEKFEDILVIGGQYADVPLSMKSVKMLPKEIIGNQLSVIIDVSDLKTHDRIMYVKDFLETMMELPKQYWIPYLVFVEEAHKFCGEQDKQESARAVKDLMSRGRKMGYCGVLITQRISKLHKDAAAECNNKFIGRTNLDLDMDRAAKELGFTSNSTFTRLSLRDLPPGKFYAYGTSIEPHHVHEVRITLPQTKMVKAGHNIDIKPKKPTPKILSMLVKLNDLPKEAEREKKTVEDLQKEVRRLTGELSNTTKGKITTPAAITPASSEQLQSLKEERSLLQQSIKDQLAQIKNWKRIATTFRDRLAQVRNIIPEQFLVIDEPKEVSFTKPLPGFEKPPKINGAKISRPVVSRGNGTLGKCPREVIKFLAQFKDRSFTKAQVAIATGYSAGSGGFNNALSELNQKGFILRDGKLQANPDAIEEIISFVGEIPDQEYNIETYRDNLGKCEREIYDVLLANPETEYSKEELSQSTETTYSAGSGGFNNALSRLNTLELIERKNGTIRLNPELLELIN